MEQKRTSYLALSGHSARKIPKRLRAKTGWQLDGLDSSSGFLIATHSI